MILWFLPLLAASICYRNCDNGYEALPDHVKQLLDENTSNTNSITSVPYFLEVNSVVVYQSPAGKPDGFPHVWEETSHYLNSPLESVWRKFGDSFAYSDVSRDLQELKELPQVQVVESRDQWTHIDYTTGIVRSSSFMALGSSVVRVDRFDDPCTRNPFLGSISKVQHHKDPHIGLQLLNVLAPRPTPGPLGITAGTQSYQDFFKAVHSIQHIGTEVVLDQQCEVIETLISKGNEVFESRTYWLATNLNGIILQRESKLPDGKLLRGICREIKEIAPSVFVGTDYCGFELSLPESGLDAVIEKLNTRYRLITLEFDPTKWPNANEDDFGFKFPKNSIVQNMLTTPTSSVVIGNDIDDVLYTFYRNPELERWCAERNLAADQQNPSEDVKSESGNEENVIANQNSTSAVIYLYLGFIGIAVLTIWGFLWYRGKGIQQ